MTLDIAATRLTTGTTRIDADLRAYCGCDVTLILLPSRLDRDEPDPLSRLNIPRMASTYP